MNKSSFSVKNFTLPLFDALKRLITALMSRDGDSEDLEIPSGFIRLDHPGANGLTLGAMALAPDPSEQIRPGPQASGDEKAVARIWNRLGGFLAVLADRLEIEVGLAVAVLMAESSGRGFSTDGRLIIRFENHVFFNQWGRRHPQKFHGHFRFDREKRWQKHQWRLTGAEPWRPVHTGAQESEWQAFNFACRLDDAAAKSSISMGAPQIMGFNHAAIGYESVGQMFEAFTENERHQIIGLFNFIKGPGAHSARLQALQRQDLHRFAQLYNGAGQAAHYATIIRKYYDAFGQLKSI